MDDLYGGFETEAQDELLVGEQEDYFDHNYEAKTDSRSGGLPSRSGLKSRLGSVQGDASRPMTSVGGAGFSTLNRPMTQSALTSAPRLLSAVTSTEEDRAMELEQKVNDLIDESVEADVGGDFASALAKAREAQSIERELTIFKKENAIQGKPNSELKFLLQLTLSLALEKNEKFQEAIDSYNNMLKNKSFKQAGNVRVNVGNIYFKQKKYSLALKMYRMAVDQVPSANKRLRVRITQNIAQCLVAQDDIKGAITNYEAMLTLSQGSPVAGYNLMLCHEKLNSLEQMKNLLTKLAAKMPVSNATNKTSETDDELSQHLQRKTLLDKSLLFKCAKLVCQKASKDSTRSVQGNVNSEIFDWAIGLFEESHPEVSRNLELEKSMTLLRQNEFSLAIDALRDIEEKSQTLAWRPANNLSFLYLNEGDVETASGYADIALAGNEYNSKALINKGNCLFKSEQFDEASEMYTKAIASTKDCIEGYYNLGLVCKVQEKTDDALRHFEKVLALKSTMLEASFQIASLHETRSQLALSEKYLNSLIVALPSDPSILSFLGHLFSRRSDPDFEDADKEYAFDFGEDSKAQHQNQAVHYFNESHRFLPVDLDVLSWLGVWYVRSELHEKAMGFFKMAAWVQPKEPKWQLMTASCHRRMNQYQRALEMYEDIHAEFPENVECLRYLIAISKDLGMPVDEYQKLLAAIDNSDTGMPTTGGFMKTGTTKFSASSRQIQPTEESIEEKSESDVTDDDLEDLLD